MSFQWDRHKAAANASKHGVTFEEAVTIFEDPLARIFSDEWHSDLELREIVIGHSSAGRLLLVAFAEMPVGTIRIVSARRATSREQRGYEERSGS
ncbi:MAG: BrnT family toxin [Chromatiaceae bacterium]